MVPKYHTNGAKIQGVKREKCNDFNTLSNRQVYLWCQVCIYWQSIVNPTLLLKDLKGGKRRQKDKYLILLIFFLSCCVHNENRVGFTIDRQTVHKSHTPPNIFNNINHLPNKFGINWHQNNHHHTINH